MKKVVVLLAVALIVLFIPSGQAFANPVGTISDGSAEFSYTGGGISGPTADFSVSGVNGGVSQMYQTWWWFRLAGDTQEYILPVNPDSQTYSGDTATLVWNDVTGQGEFSAQLVVTVTEIDGGSSASLQQDLTITNLSGSENLIIDIFTYLDLDVGASHGDDKAFLNTQNYIIDVTDSSSSTTAQFATNFQTNGTYMVGSFATVRNELFNDTVTDFANTGLDFGPEDFSAAMQEPDHTIAPGGTVTFTSGLAINDNAPTAVELQSINAATPARFLTISLVAILLVIVTVALIRRNNQHIPTE